MFGLVKDFLGRISNFEMTLVTSEWFFFNERSKDNKFDILSYECYAFIVSSSGAMSHGSRHVFDALMSVIPERSPVNGLKDMFVFLLSNWILLHF